MRNESLKLHVRIRLLLVRMIIRESLNSKSDEMKDLISAGDDSHYSY